MKRDRRYQCLCLLSRDGRPVALPQRLRKQHRPHKHMSVHYHFDATHSVFEVRDYDRVIATQRFGRAKSDPYTDREVWLQYLARQMAREHGVARSAIRRDPTLELYDVTKSTPLE